MDSPSSNNAFSVTMGELIAERRRGEDALLVKLSEALRLEVYRSARRWGFTDAAACDIASEVVRLLVAQLDAGFRKPEFNARGYCWKFFVPAAKRKELADLRKQKQAQVEVVPLEHLEETGGQKTGGKSVSECRSHQADPAIRYESQEIIRYCLRKLPSDVQEMLWSYFYARRTQQDIAKTLKMHQSQVSTSIKKYRRLFGKYLQEQGYLPRDT